MFSTVRSARPDQKGWALRAEWPAEEGGGRRLGRLETGEETASLLQVPSRVWNHAERTQVMPRQRERGLTKRTDDQTFGEVVQLIQGAQDKALRSVNTTLIELYWAVGEIISRKIAAAE